MTTDTNITAGATGLPTQAQGPDDTSATTGQGRAAEHGDGADSLTSDQMVGLLFVKRAQIFGTLAKDRIKDTQAKLQDYKKMTLMIEKMRDSQAGSSDGKHGRATTMDKDVVAFCKKYNIKLNTHGNDNVHNHTEWDYNIQSANGTREKWSDELRVLMLKLKAVMSQLDTSVSGANSLEDKSAHIAKKVVS